MGALWPAQWLCPQHRCRTCTGIPTFKNVLLPHGRYFTDGRCKFGDQIPLCLQSPFSPSCSGSALRIKLKRMLLGFLRSAGTFLPVWTLLELWVGVPWPRQHHSRFTRIWCWRHQAGQGVSEALRDGQTDRGRIRVQKLHSSHSQKAPGFFKSPSVHTDTLRAWPRIPRFKLPWVFCQICDVSLIQVRKT